jgi:hypothetical protein
MATEILTPEDLKQFHLQLLEDLKMIFPQSHQAPKAMGQKFGGTKNAGMRVPLFNN